MYRVSKRNNIIAMFSLTYWVTMLITSYNLVSLVHTVNCVDRHAVKYPDRVALIWEKDKPEESENITYKYYYS